MTRTLMADNGELVEVDCDCAECAVLRERVRELEEALNDVKNLLTGGQYSIARNDGNGMGLGEQYIIGSIFERADKALGVPPEARDG